jgi:hypothetical protein
MIALYLYLLPNQQNNATLRILFFPLFYRNSLFSFNSQDAIFLFAIFLGSACCSSSNPFYLIILLANKYILNYHGTTEKKH